MNSYNINFKKNEIFNKITLMDKLNSTPLKVKKSIEIDSNKEEEHEHIKKNSSILLNNIFQPKTRNQKSSFLGKKFNIKNKFSFYTNVLVKRAIQIFKITSKVDFFSKLKEKHFKILNEFGFMKDKEENYIQKLKIILNKGNKKLKFKYFFF